MNAISSTEGMTSSCSSRFCQVWCSASTSSPGSSPHRYQRAHTSSHEANQLRLITQPLVCSKRGERVTEPVANKSSQLLPLIIAVITLIISNSAPRYERVSVYRHLRLPRSPPLMPTSELTLVCVIMSYAQEPAWWTVPGKKAHNLFCSCSPWDTQLAYLVSSTSSTTLPYSVPLHTSPRPSVAPDRWCIQKKKNSAGWLIPAGIGLHLALSPSVNSTAGDS